MSVTQHEIINALDLYDCGSLLVVPSNGMSDVYSFFENAGKCIYVTREEEAIGIATGMTLGGKRPVVLMQQSGVGNCLNAVLTLADAYDIYFPILVATRSLRDDNPVQQVSVERTLHALRDLNCVVISDESDSFAKKFLTIAKQKYRWIVFFL